MYVETILETGKYVVSSAGSYGQLPETGGETEYYYIGVGRYGKQRPAYGFHICKTGALFL